MIPRLAGAADLDATRACVVAAFSPFIALIGRKPAPMEADLAPMIARSEVWLVGEGAGVLRCFTDGGAMQLDLLAVRPETQGQGLGRALVAHCEALALAARLPAVELYTNAAMLGAQRLYLGLGYAEIARGQHEGFSRVFYRKQLDLAPPARLTPPVP